VGRKRNVKIGEGADQRLSEGIGFKRDF